MVQFYFMFRSSSACIQLVVHLLMIHIREDVEVAHSGAEDSVRTKTEEIERLDAFSCSLLRDDLHVRSTNEGDQHIN